VLEPPPTVIEGALKSARHPFVLLLVAVPLVSWLWIVVMSRDMYGSMSGASAWMMTPTWDLPHLLLLWAMWAVMMAGMMLPSASALVLVYGVAARRSRSATAAWQIYALGAGYLAVWCLFSVAATALQRGLTGLLLLSPMMEPATPVLGAVLLIVAGVYQMTPLKLACLRRCRSPFGFLMSRWRAGVSGAFHIGFEHGIYCVGCCGPLMLLLFAGGVMNLAVIASLTALIAFEKMAPWGRVGAYVSGVLLVLIGAWMIA
jgi:predicted metal-binding membrane protein